MKIKVKSQVGKIIYVKTNKKAYKLLSAKDIVVLPTQQIILANKKQYP